MPALHRARRRLRRRRPRRPRPCTDGDEWIVNGQKVWTTLAHLAEWGMLVARTDPDAPKHKGMTYFVVDMHAPGVEVQAALPDHRRGRVQRGVLHRRPHPRRRAAVATSGDGWRVVLTTLMNERVAIGGGSPSTGRRLHRRGGEGVEEARLRRSPAKRDAAHEALDRGRGAPPHQHPGLAAAARSATPDPRARSARSSPPTLNKAISRVHRRPPRRRGHAQARRLPDGAARATP